MALALFQAAAISYFYAPPWVPQGASNSAIDFIIDFANPAVRIAILWVAVMALLNWHQRQHLLGLWREQLPKHDLPFWLGVNFVVFVMAIAASHAVSQDFSTYAHWLIPYAGLVGAWAVSLLLAAGPLEFWRQTIAVIWKTAVLAAIATVAIFGVSSLAQAGWEPLAGATLNVVAAILQIYEHDVAVDVATRDLSVGQFTVNIAAVCSGYEGIGLVTAVTSLYLYVFRRELVFPNAFFLLPIGAAAIWVFNCLRIVALVSIGAHVSPEIAVGGFHSQAGWIAFLIVTTGVMVMGQKLAVFSGRDNRAAGAIAQGETLETDVDPLPWLAPFMALLTASIIASAFEPNAQWLYALRVLAIAAVLWMFRGFYLPLIAKVAPLSLAAGLAVGVAWIATDPDPAAGAELGAWLTQLPIWAAVLWLAIRAVGTIIFVPIAEELAFRGYVNRVVAAWRVASVSPQVMMAVALVVSSLLFGVMHQRWLAAALAGAVYALVMYRTGRMSDPIAAHMVSNAVIIGWAVAAQQWSLI